MNRDGYIEEKYEILRMIGRGGMSKVYLAKDRRLGKLWAIKEAEKEGVSQGALFVSGAVAEANILKKMDHPALPRIVDIYENDKSLFVVMDYIEGSSLSSMLFKEKYFDEDTVTRWAGELVDVLGYLHSQNPPVIYRDIKPENIMITKDGRLKLIDFGIAREYKNGGQRDTMCLGTRGYAAPEQFGGRGQSDERTDIYCLGVTLHHLLTGQDPSRPPYKISPVRQIRPEISQGLENIIDKCTEPDPKERYQNIDELQEDLGGYKKLDQKYEAALYIKMGIYRMLQIAFLLAFLLMCLCVLKGRVAFENVYEEYLAKSETALSIEDRRLYLAKAMELRPWNYENYIRYVNICKEDGVFSKDEEAYLINQTEQCRDSITDINGLHLIEYNIGCLYWYYYEVENLRIVSSLPWFKRAAMSEDEISGKAELYVVTGEFYRDIEVRLEATVEEGSYGRYVDSLDEVLVVLEDEDNEVVISETLEQGLGVMENYIYRIKADGISRAKLDNLLGKMDDLANTLSPEIRASLIESEERVICEIKEAYGDNEFF